MAVVDAKGYPLQVNDRVIFHAAVTDITITDKPTSAEFAVEDPKTAGDAHPTITCIATRSEKTSVPA
jgi:hypothetical protein